MELREELIEKVERYLSGELTRKEVKEENGTTLSNEELDEAIDLFNASESLIELSGLREDLKSIHQEYIAETEGEIAKPESKSTIRMWWTVAVAAALIFLAVFSGIFQNNSPQFKDYFSAYPDILSFRGSETQMSNAMRYYSLQNYEAALEEFDKLIADSVNQEALFYQAISALAIEKLELAESNLEKLAKTTNNTFWQQTKWYLALTYWQIGDLEKAREQLAQIKPGHKEYKKAQVLLEDI